MSNLDYEKEITKYWKENKIFEKSVESRPVNKQYVFYDGPPFATGTPHYGHILGLTSKDVFPRYWTMKGYRCERRWGWDCHGLPIENIAEKDLKIKEKTGIEKLGVSKFNQYCRSKVLFYASEWKKTVDRMGKWIDFENSYKTMDASYMETIWYMFKKLYNEKLIYEGKKILMYCPRCETPVAKAEIAMDNSYKTVTEKSATAKFKLVSEDASILAWTTTPWTLIGNVALAVNPKLDYVKIETNNEKLILAKDRISEIKTDYKILSTFKGKELVNKKYIPLYKLSEDKAYIVIDGGKEVTSEDGTGIVHMAIYGEFDHEMIKKYNLSIVQHLNEKGNVILGPKDFIGTYFKDVDKKVIKDLEERNLLFEDKNYTHEYPFCYRCKTPLFYNAVDSWFVNITKIKPLLLEKAKQIKWHPTEGTEKRFMNNIKSAPDWTISRNRFWATSIPVWKCTQCDEVKVIGSVKELQENATQKVKNDVDLHKDVMDKIHLKCKCGKKMNRVPEVIDCWFESGSMPYAAKHYPFENKEFFKTNFPSDFISEYVGQIRAWFYYMHVMGVLMFKKQAYKNCVVTGNIMAADGQKMSKSLKNYPDPKKIFDDFGADALRFYLMNSLLTRAKDLNFKEEGVKEVYRRVVMLLNNVNNFYLLFKGENKNFSKTNSKNVLDKWIISNLNILIKEITLSLDDYDTLKSCNLILDFINDLSTWYVRRSRTRFKSKDKDAIETLGYIIFNLIKVMAPITPFITEHVYLKLRETNDKLLESVHLEKWPKFDESLINKKIMKNMELTRKIVSKALDERDKAKIPVRQALSKITVKGAKLNDDYVDLIKEEVNIKTVNFTEGKELSVSLDTKITPELKREGIARDLMRKLNNYRKKLGLVIKDRVILYFYTNDNLINQSFKEHEQDIMDSIQANEVKIKKMPNSKEIKIDNIIVNVLIKKL